MTTEEKIETDVEKYKRLVKEKKERKPTEAEIKEDKVRNTGGILVGCSICFKGGHTKTTLYRRTDKDGSVNMVCKDHLFLYED